MTSKKSARRHRRPAPSRDRSGEQPSGQGDQPSGQEIAERSARMGVPEEELQGPPPATLLQPPETPPPAAAELTGGDVDADWQRAADVGEEAVGGSVATPDQDRVDAIGEALGVPRAPDDEVRTSAEILEGRDEHRWEQEP